MITSCGKEYQICLGIKKHLTKSKYFKFFENLIKISEAAVYLLLNIFIWLGFFISFVCLIDGTQTVSKFKKLKKISEKLSFVLNFSIIRRN